jgi:hypothetical protein
MTDALEFTESIWGLNPTENVSLVADLGADSQHGNLAVPNYMIGNASQEQLG